MGDQPQFDFKANYLNFLNHKPTTPIPNSFVGNKVMSFGAINCPAIEKGAQFGDRMDIASPASATSTRSIRRLSHRF